MVVFARLSGSVFPCKYNMFNLKIMAPQWLKNELRLFSIHIDAGMYIFPNMLNLNICIWRGKNINNNYYKKKNNIKTKWKHAKKTRTISVKNTKSSKCKEGSAKLDKYLWKLWKKKINRSWILLLYYTVYCKYGFPYFIKIVKK